MLKQNEIMNELDKWVHERGNGEYIPKTDSPELTNFGRLPDYGIQQVRAEIAEFVGVLLRHGKRSSILEIGLGFFGSTHFLWRMIFDRVATIEKNDLRIFEFGQNTRTFYGKWILDSGSALFTGFSTEAPIVQKVYAQFRDGVDVLFIDGDHSYAGIIADWLLYAPLVRPGGIVAFHDMELYYAHDRGPKGFFEDLEGGKLTYGKRFKIERIQHSKYHGIGYYIKE